nr:unnamed protein product [Digitaria exilis]
MPNDRANWSDMATKTLLDLCIEQKRLFNWNRLGPSPHGWQNIYPKFEQQTGLHYGHKQVQNKLGTLKRAYKTWKELQNSSGLGRDRNTGGVAADDTYWIPTQGDTSSEQQTHGKPPPFLEELELLFGHTPQDRGTLLTTGGVRESTPTIGSDDTPQEISEDPHSASAVRNTSKRTSRDEVVDSPQKKKSASMEDYVKEISESVAKRCERRSREQEECDRTLQILEEDGIMEGSELYCMATYLCTKAANRRFFTQMKTKEGRLNWIKFHLEKGTK